MSWIESHQSLSRHRKTMKAARLLKCDRHKLIGHLHAMWWWGLDNAAEDGALPGIERSDLAAAAEWRGDPEAFAVVLIEVGFIDSDPTGAHLRLHDWWDYAGKLYDQKELRKESNREAQRRRREKLRSADSQHDNDDSQHDSHDDSQRGQQPTYQPTVPTNQERTPSVGSPSQDDGGVCVSEFDDEERPSEEALAAFREEFDGPERAPRVPVIASQVRTERDAQFAAFRADWPPNPDGNPWNWHDARRAWNEHVPPDSEAACLEKARLYAQSGAVQRGRCMAPANWLPGWREQTAGKPASAKDANTAPNYLRAVSA